MFVATITKIENHGSKKWVDFSEVKSGKYSETQLPENYTAEEFSKVNVYAANVEGLSVYNQLITDSQTNEFILREIIAGPNGNFISIRVSSPESLERWRSGFSSLSNMRDEILEMINATMVYKDVNCDSYQDILKILKCSYDQLNSIYFQS